MKKLLKLFSLIAVVATFSAHAEEAKHATETKAKPYKEVTAEELQKLITDNKDVVVIDSRGSKYLEGEIIAGAKILSTDDTNAENLAKIVPNKKTTIVFYCQNHDCPASAKAAYKAKEAGYNNLLKYPGGIEEWVSKKLPTEKLATK